MQCPSQIKQKQGWRWLKEIFIPSSVLDVANSRADSRAESTTDFIYKLKIVEEEADETIYWLVLFQEVLNPGKNDIQTLIKEANELLAIVVASIKTLRKKERKDC